VHVTCYASLHDYLLPLTITVCSLNHTGMCEVYTKTKQFFHSVRLHLVVGRVAEYPLWLI